MTKRLIILLSAICTIMACTSTRNSYKINIVAPEFADGTQVEISLSATHQDEKPFMVGEVNGGELVFEGEIDEPRLCILRVDEDILHFFMLANENITFTLSAESIEVSGSPMTDEYLRRNSFREELNKIYDQNWATYNAAIAAADAEKDPKKAEQMRADARAVMAEAEGKFFAKVEEVMMKGFRDNGDDFWGPMLVLNNINYFSEGDTTYINLYERDFSEKARNSFYGQMLHKQLFPPTLVGKPLPEMTGMDKNGVEQSLKELCAGKKYVIIDFWASWCGPCRKSIPALKEFYKKYAPKGVEIIGISIDKREADWKKALEQEKLPWPNIIDNNNVNSSLFLVRAVPTMYVVNSEGIVVSNNFYDQEERAKWCSEFDEL